jgi:preprotein translocase SecE subunit
VPSARVRAGTRRRRTPAPGDAAMYKWPQGKVIRTVCAVLALVIAIDLGWNGAQSQLVPYFSDEQRQWRQLVIGSFFALLSLIALFGGLIAVGFQKKSVDFLIEVEQEMTRVTWPTGRDLVRSTIFIAVMIVTLSAGILLVDFVNKNILDHLLKVHS